ncbi:uncharacterized protein LOC131861197 [Cryptomeria japonica]|uniref:uncharacterized protein LOC131861197 n=1 Tax=Cryptomeria japonica TaxID=3369 RepID=UPI0027DA8F29|nr:uncharacterized protein LOC131861197 [Cryptomeria japonica]
MAGRRPGGKAVAGRKKGSGGPMVGAECRELSEELVEGRRLSGGGQAEGSSLSGGSQGGGRMQAGAAGGGGGAGSSGGRGGGAVGKRRPGTEWCRRLQGGR